jgi:hypothetical protein
MAAGCHMVPIVAKRSHRSIDCIALEMHTHTALPPCVNLFPSACSPYKPPCAGLSSNPRVAFVLADTHGIVYTPQEIVDFMCASVEEVLQTESGLTPGVNSD